MKHVRELVTLLEHKQAELDKALKVLRNLDRFAKSYGASSNHSTGRRAKRVLSAAARRRIAIAQRKRWRKVRAAKKGKA